MTPDADPDHGGFGARVHGLASMFARFADVRLVRTDWMGGPRIPGVEYCDLPVRDSALTRLRRMGTYYRSHFPPRPATDPPDLVLVESLDLLGLHQYGTQVPMVLDEHNVYWNLLEYDLVSAPFFRTWVGRRATVRRWLAPALLKRARRFEVEAIRRSARTLVTSEVDRGEILAECPDAAPKLRVLPNCIDVERIPVLPEHPGSRAVVFVGDFNYVPNREAAEFTIRSLAPQLPDADFLLVGSRPPTDLPSPPNVRMTGRVPNLLGILEQSAVCIAPLSHGSGTRIKILTYLAAGRAVVATTKACEGLPVRDGRELLIRDDPAGFQQAVRELLEDEARRRRLGTAGRALVESTFDWRVHVPALQQIAREVTTEAARADPAGSRASRRGEVRAPVSEGLSGPASLGDKMRSQPSRRIEAGLGSAFTYLKGYLRSRDLLYVRRARVVCRRVPVASEADPAIGIDVSEASMEDLRAIAGTRGHEMSEWLARAERGNLCLVARSGPTYLGYLWSSRSRELMTEVNHVLDVTRDAAGVYLYDGYVFPPYRRKGVLRALLASSMERARDQGASRLYAAFARENHASERALIQAGFVTVVGDVSLLRVLGREWKRIRVPPGTPWADVLSAGVPLRPRPSPT